MSGGKSAADGVPEYPLIVVALIAPIMACHPDRPGDLHAVTMEGVCEAWGIGKPDAEKPTSATAACGAGGLRLVVSKGFLAEWPPRVRTLPPGFTRCRECQQATGNKRPRSEWTAVAS